MKLYISYYGNYVSIVEGKYNYKKDKYLIKDLQFISSEDVDIDYDDKYSLLREALKLIQSKTKNVVLCLNTRDVIIKQNNILKVSPKDLDGIMKNEMYEMMSLDYEKYTFSYEVTKENIKDNSTTLDVIMAAILNDELDTILNIFKENKLNLECIDTMSTSYDRLLKNIVYEDIMMLNIGNYGSLVNIYANDSLFIHDNIPIKINDKTNHDVCLALVDEIRGLINFYSSRNFGKNVDNIVLIGEQNHNKEVVNTFREEFDIEVLEGIEYLFDIEEDIKGDLQNYEISKICDALGSMLINKYKKGYNTMNLLPYSVIDNQRNKDSLKKGLSIGIVSLIILSLPYIALCILNSKINRTIESEQINLDSISEQYKRIDAMEKRIEDLKEQISIYDSLESKSITWAEVLDLIDNNIPYTVDLTNIDVYYNEGSSDNKEENISEDNKENANSQQDNETPIYEQIPNTMVIEGISNNSYNIGQFVYSLTHLSCFESVQLKSTTKDEENGGYNFNIVVVLKEGAVLSE